MRARALPEAVVLQLVVFERRDESVAAKARDTGSMGAAALGYDMLDAVTHGQRRLGALLAGAAAGGRSPLIVDLNRALAVKLAAEDAGAPEAEADSLLPPDVTPFLRRLPDSLAAARSALAFVAEGLGRYDAPDFEAAGVALPRRAVRLAAPVPRPGKLLGVLPSDPDPAAASEDPAREPRLVVLAPTAVAGPEDEIRLPASGAVRCRAQLAAVVGRRARDLTPDRALACIAGYCTALSLWREDDTLPAGPIRLSADGCSPLGPCLVTADEAPDPHDLRLELRLSGRTLQSAHTKECPIPLPEMLAAASSLMTLEPGDVVLSGAPRGGTREAARPLRDGDVVEVEIERIGRLALYAGVGT